MEFQYVAAAELIELIVFTLLYLALIVFMYFAFKGMNEKIAKKTGVRIFSYIIAYIGYCHFVVWVGRAIKLKVLVLTSPTLDQYMELGLQVGIILIGMFTLIKCLNVVQAVEKNKK